MNANRDQIKETVLLVLGRIVPEADTSTLAADIALREQLDIDSFDFLTFVIGLHEALGVEIPEADYGKLATLERTVAYLATAQPDTPARTGRAAVPTVPPQRPKQEGGAASSAEHSSATGRGWP
jgi:acyl carrier protein